MQEWLKNWQTHKMYADHELEMYHKISSVQFDSPLSEGEDGSLSSRSSADDMVPVEGVLGNFLLKSPEQ